MMNIQPQLIKFAELLENRLFRIPRYQRAYSWRNEERQDMFNDLTKLKGKPTSSHFMATVVGLRCDTRQIGTDEYKVIEIVDGQQRLTTLLILLKAIEKKLASLLGEAETDVITLDESKTIPKVSLERELREVQELLVKPDELSLILLQTNHDRSQYFANFIREGTLPPAEGASTLADRELLNAMKQCKDFVQKWGNPIELLRLLKNHLWFIFHEISDVKTVYTVFEVLNDRGLEVSWLAKFKSRLMKVVVEADQGNSDEHINELHHIWGDFYETVGLREDNGIEALRFASTLRYHRISRILADGKAVESLMEEVGANVPKTIEISKWILKVLEAVDSLQEKMRQPVTKIRHARMLAVAIILRDFPEEDERKLLDQWEKTSFCIFGLCRKDARTGVGDFVELAKDINDNLDLSIEDISEKIRQLRSDYTDKVREHLSNADCYTGWEAELRYVLCRYEEHLAEQQGQTFDNEQWNRIWEKSAAESIEHILPQSTTSSENVHRLGNLLLLRPGLNSQLGPKSPQEKADSYRGTGLLIAGEVAETILTDGWDEAQIKSREEKIITWICDRFL